MNKKILTLFLVVAASAILAVSCNNKTTNPVKDNTGSTTTTTPTGQEPTTTTPAGGAEEAQKTAIKTDEIQKVLVALNEKKDNDSTTKAIMKFAKSSVSEDGKVSGVTATGKSDEAKGPSIEGVKKIIATLNTSTLKIAGVKEIKVADAGITSSKDNNAKSFTLTLTADDKYEFANKKNELVLTVSIDPKKGNADEAVAWED
ncbi:hypothetical protein R4K54_09735 [Brachyspira murdochii]|uniref:SmpB outer membrane protein n=1 Tax=Brachyspira murdochii (strain ATCC 51284 / DSM 12563 / 56-150) TaxID=526224 RepID=D5U6T9_BRAM5|nr:hypothetical protein [Brachyspira murdochii]ADG70655.1 SmpB outer membrane protein [Brachyspira murdochii DSM 12563]